MMRKLDIKPHQSPRRAAVQLQARHPRTESISSVTNSPLILADRVPPAMDKEAGDTDVLGEGVVGKYTKKHDTNTTNGKRRQAKRRKTEVVPEKPSKQSEGNSAQPRRQSVSGLSYAVFPGVARTNAHVFSFSVGRKPVLGIGTS